MLGKGREVNYPVTLHAIGDERYVIGEKQGVSEYEFNFCKSLQNTVWVVTDLHDRNDT